MKTLKLSVLVLVVAGNGLLACGSNGPNAPEVGNTIQATGGSPGADSGGAGGAGGYDAGPVVVTDTNQQVPEDGPAPIDGPPTPPPSQCLDCTGLTPQQCQDRIINWTACPLDPTILQQDPGPNPPVPYPACSAT